jgi:uncharacterized membrane protein YraQ (UPF0718 family)
MPRKGRTDPICGMEGHIKAHGHYFCSVGCIRNFEKREGIKKGLYCPECSAEAHHHKKRWYKERLYQVLIVLGILFVIDRMLLVYGITALQGFWLAFYDYLALIWWAIVLGFLIGGIIDYLVPSEYISKFLSKRERKTIGWAVILGFLMSACSHGILAISMEFYRKGASVPAVIAFLMASPWANLPITILLFSFFGLNAIFFILSAILIAIITGFFYQFLDRKGWVERSKHTRHVSESFSVREDARKRWRSFQRNPSLGKVLKGTTIGSWSLTKMVMWWILIGVMAAALARTFIHPELFTIYMGPTLLGLFVTLVIATAIEVCSEGSSPISFEIYNQTGALGNSFTFLMAGVATDYTEIGIIGSNIGKRAALWLPVITVPQILVLGYLFNMLL